MYIYSHPVNVLKWGNDGSTAVEPVLSVIIMVWMADKITDIYFIASPLHPIICENYADEEGERRTVQKYPLVDGYTVGSISKSIGTEEILQMRWRFPIFRIFAQIFVAFMVFGTRLGRMFLLRDEAGETAHVNGQGNVSGHLMCAFFTWGCWFVHKVLKL